MKKIQSVIILCSFICATSAMAANDRHVALCALGFSLIAMDNNRASAILARADNEKNAKQILSKYFDTIETSPNGNFSERGAKKLMMDHSDGCKAIGIKNAIQ